MQPEGSIFSKSLHLYKYYTSTLCSPSTPLLLVVPADHSCNRVYWGITLGDTPQQGCVLDSFTRNHSHLQSWESLWAVWGGFGTKDQTFGLVLVGEGLSLPQSPISGPQLLCLIRPLATLEWGPHSCSMISS